MKQTTAQSKNSRTTMYRMVFDSVTVKCAVSLLFAFLLLQPVAPAFANELIAEPEPEIPENNDSENSFDLPENEPAPTEEEISQQTEEAAPSSEPAVVAYETVAEDALPIEPLPQSDEVLEGSATSTTNEDGEPAEEVQPEEVVEEPAPEPEEEVLEEEEVVPLSEGETEVATTTTEAATTTGESVLVVDHNTNELQFNPDECASVGEGAFYCSEPKDAETFIEDGVFAAPDVEGDMEIFLRVDGELLQITHNTTDDKAPYYDAKSERIVWHTNHHDRYQIVSFDMESGEETRLTDASYNNMEPVAYGDITMYQAWLDNNWEIMFRDDNGERRLTTNTQHDVSPSIRGGYIVWQTQFDDGWQVAVYDQATDHIEYIRSEGGAKVENPRFVLVYDSTNDVGDIQTIGYDLNNKRSFTLGSIPAELPDELPDPDQTGETRALIQNKQTVRDTEIEEGEPTPTAPVATTTPQNGISDIDLTSSSTPQINASSTTVISEIEDIVITDILISSTSPDTTHIEDVVIPPLLSTSTADVR